MYAVGWASNSIAVIDQETGLIEDQTIETVVRAFDDEKVVHLCGGIEVAAKLLDVKVVDRRGIGMKIHLRGCDNPSVIPEGAQVLIRRLISKCTLPRPFNYNLPSRLYSSPFYVKAASVLESDLVATPDHHRSEWFGNSVRLLAGAARYRSDKWLEYSAAFPKLPFRHSILPGTDKDFDGVATPIAGKTWLRISSINEVKMDSLVAMSIDSPGGVICDGIIVQAMVGSCAKVP